MSYEAGEARILTLLQAISPTVWTAQNSVSLANDTSNLGMRMLNQGKSHHYLYLEPAPFGTQYQTISFTEALITWQTKIKIYVLKTSNRGPMSVLAVDRGAILAQLLKYERLNALSGVMHAGPIGPQTGGPILTERVPAANKKKIVYFKQEVIWQWDELVSISQQD